MKSKTPQLPPLEAGLLRAMQALDNQIEKEVGKRTPAELESAGVQKWLPYDKRIERVASFILNSLGDNEIKLDSLLILAQSLTKSLQLLVSDLGPEALGKMRTSYCRDAMEKISRDTEVMRAHLSDPSNTN